ncbi:PINIT domain-containing protein [Mariannaea sp. PMI_226]|nr:PINIT domain-containing protein [Mariannaea sp. PMI_226]
MASTSGLGATVPGLPSTAAVSRQEAHQLSRQVSRLLNRQLSSICQINGLKSTGIKVDLQTRINNLIEETLRANDAVRFQQVRQSIHNTISNASASGSSPARGLYSLGASVNHNVLHPPAMGYNEFSPDAHGNHPSAPPRLHVNFRPSPFYKFERPIGEVRVCDNMPSHRNTVSIQLKLQEHPALQKCLEDSSYRVMVFCAGDNSPGMHNISFPHQSEIRVNGTDIKANLRGLKNKPGSTRPVDITSALRIRGAYPNTLDFTYALTTKVGCQLKYYLVINLCQVTSVEQLVTSISNGMKISVDSVLKEFKQKVQDPDVVATSQVLSLKCPLSYMRLKVPCRGISCQHNSCFDATSYLQLQEQGPQWLCPICNNPAPFERLAVDNYVREILDNTSKDLEAVTIEPDGRWFIKKSDEDEKNDYGSQEPDVDSLDDDDELEISQVNVLNNRHLETPKNSAFNSSSPGSGSRATPSAGPRGTASTSAKRPAAAVIDLTLSSDDDEEPVERAPKRQNTGINGLHNPSLLAFPNGAHGYSP